MTFADPAILAGMGLLAIPLALRILARGRYRVLVVSTLAFVRPKGSRMRALLRRDSLGLALRLLLVAAVVLLLAGPMDLSSPARPVGASTVLVLACEQGTSEPVAARRAQVLSLVDACLESVPRGSRVMVVVADAPARWLSGPTAVDASTARSLVGGLVFLGQAQHLDRALAAVAQSPVPPARVVILAPNLARAWRLLASWPLSDRTIAVPLASAPEPVWIESLRYRQGQGDDFPARLDLALGAVPAGIGSTVVLRVESTSPGGNDRVLIRSELAVPREKPWRLSLPMRLGEEGSHLLRVMIEGSAPHVTVAAVHPPLAVVLAGQESQVAAAEQVLSSKPFRDVCRLVKSTDEAFDVRLVVGPEAAPAVPWSRIERGCGQLSLPALTVAPGDPFIVGGDPPGLDIQPFGAGRVARLDGPERVWPTLLSPQGPALLSSWLLDVAQALRPSHELPVGMTGTMPVAQGTQVSLVDAQPGEIAWELLDGPPGTSLLRVSPLRPGLHRLRLAQGDRLRTDYWLSPYPSPATPAVGEEAAGGSTIPVGVKLVSTPDALAAASRLGRDDNLFWVASLLCLFASLEVLARRVRS